MSNPTIALAHALIARPSVTPDDAGCLEILGEKLAQCGFMLERIDQNGTSNLWATRFGAQQTGEQMLVFAGHTDVVPVGKRDLWQTDPFVPTEKDGFLYGRGAADMKGSLAAMLTAIEKFTNKHPKHAGSIGILFTSDEEGPAHDGTKIVVEALRTRGFFPEWCIVGEPSSQTTLGDIVRPGRRGSLTADVTILGTQGHVAYPEKANNPIHAVAPFLRDLCLEKWDNGNADFPPTSLQIVSIQSGAGADNIIPAECKLTFNFRYSTENNYDKLTARTEALLNKHNLIKNKSYVINWRHSGAPFLSEANNKLRQATHEVILEKQGFAPIFSTGGGTSDGRFIATLGTAVIELGPVNATIHQVNECVKIQDLIDLSELYYDIMVKLLA